MNREEDGDDEVVCLDESFFINDEWVRVRDKFLSSPFLFIFINSLMILLIHTHSLSPQLSAHHFHFWLPSSSPLLPPICFKWVFSFSVFLCINIFLFIENENMRSKNLTMWAVEQLILIWQGNWCGLVLCLWMIISPKTLTCSKPLPFLN